jgi:hypothetical protein
VLHRYEWLPDDEQWRAGVAWRQRRWLPQWLRDHIWENWFEDFEQIMEMCVYISHAGRLSLEETRKVVGNEIRAYLRAMGITARGGTGWTTVEAPARSADIADQNSRLISEICKRSLVTAIEDRRPKINLQNLRTGPKMGPRTCVHCGDTVWAEIHMQYCNKQECQRERARNKKLRFNEKKRLFASLAEAS